MPDTIDSPIDWEAEYNVRLLHPDRETYHARCVASSKAAYRSLACLPGLRYGPGGRALIDFFPPATSAPEGLAPLVAWFHGGYWHSHERSEYAFVARTLAQAGIATALVGYDLAPSAGMHEIVAQARAACRWLRGQAAELGCDEQLIFTAGHSAGAHLAAGVLTDPQPQDVKGAVLVSGIFELDPLRSTSLNATLGLTAASARRLSPRPGARQRACDLLVAVGAFETTEFLRQSREFAHRWPAAAGSAELLVVPAAHHYSVVLELARGDSALSRAAVHRVLRTSALVVRRARARRR
jgi:arylformamidase